MNSKKALERKVLAAARDQGISSVIYRNTMGRKLGLTITDFEALSFITLQGSATPTEIARYTGLTTGSTTALLDRLERAGLINRANNPKDRRGVIVSVNEKYSQAAAPLVSGILKAHNELLASYTESELGVIADFLDRFTQNVRDQINMIDT